MPGGHGPGGIARLHSPGWPESVSECLGRSCGPVRPWLRRGRIGPEGPVAPRVRGLRCRICPGRAWPIREAVRAAREARRGRCWLVGAWGVPGVGRGGGDPPRAVVLRAVRAARVPARRHVVFAHRLELVPFSVDAAGCPFSRRPAQAPGGRSGLSWVRLRGRRPPDARRAQTARPYSLVRSPLALAHCTRRRAAVKGRFAVGKPTKPLDSSPSSSSWQSRQAADETASGTKGTRKGGGLRPPPSPRSGSELVTWYKPCL